MNSAGLGVIGLVGLCGGVVAFGSVTAAGSDTELASGDMTQEVVRSVAVSCPELFKGQQRRAVVTMASIPGLPGQDQPGTLELTSTDGPNPLATLAEAGTSTSFGDFGSDAMHAVATGLGGLAPGALVGRSSIDDSGEGQGLASSRCAEPSSSEWLLGGGATLGQRDRIVLLNPTDSDAVVDLEIYGPDGKIEANGTDSIAVKPRERAELRLDALAEDVPVTAVHFRTRVGLVSGYIVDDRMEELTPRGTEIIGASASPSVRSVIAGLPDGPGVRELALFAPSGRGTARVRALSADGPIDLGDAGVVKIRKDRVAWVDLSGPIGGKPVSLVIEADVPLLASVGVQTRESEADKTSREAAVAAAEAELKNAKDAAARADATQKLSDVKTEYVDEGSDIAWFAASPHIPQIGAAAGLLADSRSTVTVAATDDEVVARVSLLDSNGKPAASTTVEEVNVASDTSQAINVKAPSKGTYTVIVERTGGPGRLFASQFQEGANKALTGYALARISPWVDVPEAEPVFGPME